MFDALSDRLERIAGRLRSRGRLTDADLDEALAEIRTALLEADVELGVVRGFVAAVRERCSGEALSKSLSPGQQVIKAVHEELVSILGGETLKLTYASRPPTVVLLADCRARARPRRGQARPVVEGQGRNPLLVARRPPAPCRRRAVARPRFQAGVTVFSQPGDPVATAKAGVDEAVRLGRDVCIIGHRRSPGHRRGADGRGPPDLRGDRSALHVLGHRTP